MLDPVYTLQFQKDVKRERRGKWRTLLAEEALDPIHRDHRLVGAYLGRRECHIESDWLLIYKVEPARVVFERTGSHSDLFKK